VGEQTTMSCSHQASAWFVYSIIDTATDMVIAYTGSFFFHDLLITLEMLLCPSNKIFAQSLEQTCS
jgi:hypothetical protein